jgi:hypothetical protein
MTSVANTFIDVAVPTLVSSLHAGAGELQWIVDAYSLVFARSFSPTWSSPSSPWRPGIS